MTPTLCFILGVANLPPLKIISQVDKENYRGAPGGAPIFTWKQAYFKLRMFFIEIYIIVIEQEIARFRK